MSNRAVRELAEELLEDERIQDLNVEVLESRLRAFLAEREAAPHDAHVVEKIRHGGDRHGERVFYAVGPVRGSLAEAHDDEAKMVETTVSRREDELQGQLAQLRELLEAVDQVCRDSFRDAGTTENHRTVPVCPLCSGEAVCDEECPAPDIRRALASGAGEKEAEKKGQGNAHFAVAERIEAYLLNRKFDGRRLSVIHAAELSSHIATIALDALRDARGGKGEG